MKYIIFICLLLTGCQPDYEVTLDSKEKCFADGGSEFQMGLSGSGRHDVCVFKKQKE